MAKYYIAAPAFTYVGASGMVRHVLRDNQPYATNLFITTDPALDLPAGWVPPLIGLKPGDSAAQAALVSARSGVAGQVLVGLGLIPTNEPVWSP